MIPQASVGRAVCIVFLLSAFSSAQALDEVKLGGLSVPEEKPEATKHTLAAAKKFEGRKYGEKEGQLVCTTYAAAVLTEAGYRVTKQGMKVINIQWGWSVPQIE